MADFFNLAVGVVMDHEKGYVDNPVDRGGPTKYGVTIAALSAYLGRAATVDEIKTLDYFSATQVYKKLYWDMLAFATISEPEVAVVLFDLAVLCGGHTVISRLQTVLGDVSVSGRLSQQTLDSLAKKNIRMVISKLLQLTALGFTSDVKKRPAQFVFLGGWLNRLYSLDQFTITLEDPHT